eukprot:2833909-Amphidinium_carterae.2
MDSIEPRSPESQGLGDGDMPMGEGVPGIQTPEELALTDFERWMLAKMQQLGSAVDEQCYQQQQQQQQQADQAEQYQLIIAQQREILTQQQEILNGLRKNSLLEASQNTSEQKPADRTVVEMERQIDIKPGDELKNDAKLASPPRPSAAPVHPAIALVRRHPIKPPIKPLPSKRSRVEQAPPPPKLRPRPKQPAKAKSLPIGAKPPRGGKGGKRWKS